MAYSSKPANAANKQTVADFLANGGKAQQIAEGVKAEPQCGRSAESIINAQYGNSLSDGAFMQAVERLKCERGY